MPAAPPPSRHPWAAATLAGASLGNLALFFLLIRADPHGTRAPGAVLFSGGACMFQAWAAAQLLEGRRPYLGWLAIGITFLEALLAPLLGVEDPWLLLLSVAVAAFALGAGLALMPRKDEPDKARSTTP